MTSQFIQDAINTRLRGLRDDCALKREAVRHAFGKGWSGAKPSDPPCSWDKYWMDVQEAARRERPSIFAAALNALRDFITEHRPVMGDSWPGTDHGRLCWSVCIDAFNGPIDTHYCQLPEGHAGPCKNEAGEWFQHPTETGQPCAVCGMIYGCVCVMPNPEANRPASAGPV